MKVMGEELLIALEPMKGSNGHDDDENEKGKAVWREAAQAE